MRERALLEAGVEGQRSLLPGRAHGETRVAADISPPRGKWPDGLLVLHQGSKKDRAEGGVNADRVDGLCVRVRDSVRAEASAQETGGVPEEATGWRDVWEVEVLAAGRAQRPGRGQCERSRRPGGRGSQCKARVSVGEERARVKGHTDQCPGGEGSGEGTSSTKLKGQCSRGQSDGVNARLQGRCGGREQGSGPEDNGGEGAVPGAGIVQAFLFPIVTSWQIPKLKGPSSGDSQPGRAGPGRPEGPRCQPEGLGTAPCGAGALGAGCCSALSRRGLCPRRARVLAG